LLTAFCQKLDQSIRQVAFSRKTRRLEVGTTLAMRKHADKTSQALRENAPSIRAEIEVEINQQRAEMQRAEDEEAAMTVSPPGPPHPYYQQPWGSMLLTMDMVNTTQNHRHLNMDTMNAMNGNGRLNTQREVMFPIPRVPRHLYIHEQVIQLTAGSTMIRTGILITLYLEEECTRQASMYPILSRLFLLR
jgi:hypothetical protein